MEKLITETQACLQAADHYLLMLGSVADERDHGDPPATGPDDEPPF